MGLREDKKKKKNPKKGGGVCMSVASMGDKSRQISHVKPSHRVITLIHTSDMPLTADTALTWRKKKKEKPGQGSP